ncbi:tail fiber domain-containing protein [Pseudomonadales bacterium]|nr:tail fiber domain-containing protein [Pseudomonadales bacterium]
MAGIQIDGVNNKIDFDDDLDTSISANTDDTLVIEAGGNTMATITATTFTINDGTTITTADNTDTLTLTSTDADGSQGPILRLNRDSGSPADGDVIGEIHFNADDDAGNTTEFFSMSANIRDASNGDEDVQMVFNGFRGGNRVNYLEFDSDHVVFNEGGANIDLRVESTGAANMLIVDASANAVYVNTDNSAGHISGASFAVSGNTTLFQSGNSDNLTLLTTDADANVGPNLNFYRNSSSPADGDLMGQIKFTGESAGSGTHTYGSIVMENNGVTDGQEQGKIKFNISMPDGALANVFNIDRTEICINEDSEDLDFRVESDDDTHMLFIDGGSNKVGIRQSDPNAFTDNYNDLVVGTHSGSNGITIACQNNAQASLAFSTAASGDALHKGRIAYDGANNFMTFSTDGASERMRIGNTGNVGIGYTDNDYRFAVSSSADNSYISKLRNTHASNPFGLFVQYTSAAPDSAANYAFAYQDSSTTRFLVASNGNVTNHDNSYGAISDERIKQDIRDSNSQWEDIKAVKVRNFKKKDDVRQYGDDAWEQIGVVAQELEAVSPKLIRHNDPDASDILSSSEFGTLYTETQDEVLYTSDDQEVIDGDKNVGDVKTPKKEIGEVKEIKEQVKSVSYSVLYMKAIKALQEAQTRIETLETKVAALEG